jgi:hypothetical protein
MSTENLDLALSQRTAAECNEATDELARHLDAIRSPVTMSRHAIAVLRGA